MCLLANVSYAEYARLIPISYDDFRNRITYVICTWITVSVFRNSKARYYFGKESIQKISGFLFSSDYFTIINQGDSSR